MGLYKHNGDGNLQIISGRGKAEYGASAVRTGNFTIQMNITDSIYDLPITFSSPMPDADYIVDLSYHNQHGCVSVLNGTKTVNGFTARASCVDQTTVGDQMTVTYTAFKLYTDNEYNNILASMPSNASASNKLLAEDEFVIVQADLHRESLPAGIGELFINIPVPTGYSPFCIVDYDLGRLQGLNITGMSLAAVIGKVRLATYCDKAITEELNGNIRIMCRKN